MRNLLISFSGGETSADDAQEYPEPSLFDLLLDTPGGCGESCEVFADEYYAKEPTP